MNNELLTILNFMEKERGIDREVLLTAVEYALQSAAKKSVETTREVRIAIDRKTCDIRAYAPLDVVEDAKDPREQISLAKARKIKP